MSGYYFFFVALLTVTVPIDLIPLREPDTSSGSFFIITLSLRRIMHQRQRFCLWRQFTVLESDLLLNPNAHIIHKSDRTTQQRLQIVPMSSSFRCSRPGLDFGWISDAYISIFKNVCMYANVWVQQICMLPVRKQMKCIDTHTHTQSIPHSRFGVNVC